MPSNYLPSREAELVTWTNDFRANILATPEAYGLTAAQATQYQATRTTLVNAYNTVQNPITRTPPNFAAKNAAKTALIKMTRQLVDVIQAFPGTTNEKRRQLKISERDRKPTPSPIPSMPFVKVVSVNGRDVTLSIQQSKTTKRKPKGALLANVMVAYAESAPEGVAGWNFVTGTGRTTVTVTLDGVQEACTAWVTAFWVNGRKESSQAATPIPINLGAMSAAPVTMKLKKAA